MSPGQDGPLKQIVSRAVRFYVISISFVRKKGGSNGTLKREMGSCDGGGCKSDCRGEREEKAKGKIVNDGRDLCYKCRESAGVFNNLCGSCFRFSLYGKFKTAVTSNAMISPKDKILVALSGGPSSRSLIFSFGFRELLFASLLIYLVAKCNSVHRVALEFVHEMQLKAQKSWDASKDQALPVFGVGAVFIDESTYFKTSAKAIEKAIEEMESRVSSLKPPEKSFHVVSVESIFSEDLKDDTGVIPLLESVTDVTGKEDLLRYLRMISLQKVWHFI